MSTNNVDRMLLYELIFGAIKVDYYCPTNIVERMLLYELTLYRMLIHKVKV